MSSFMVFGTIALGLLNWIATEILVTSEICREPREFLANWGERQKAHSRWRAVVGRKVTYFVQCALCVGVWVGLIEGLVFKGPLHLQTGWLQWSAFVANGLLYKAIGHLALQVNGLAHNAILHIQAQTRCIEARTEEIRQTAQMMQGSRPTRQQTAT